MKRRLFAILLCATLLFTGCAANTVGDGDVQSPPQGGNTPADIGGADFDGGADVVGGADDSISFGESLDELGAYAGYFEDESAEIEVTCISGSEDAFVLDGSTLTFTEITEETVYSISGRLRGCIVIDVGDEYKLELELCGLSLVCNSTNPIMIKSGDEVSLKAKKDTKNYIYDMREAIDEEDETLYSGAIRSEVDLELCGKGELFVISENNNGIHTKKDLQVKNLSLTVACIDNALKGKDSVEIESGSTTLIASGGDCIKTSSSEVSEKGNQRGAVSITGGVHELYAACDGIDAAYDVVIDGADTVLSIYTDKYSSYSGEVTATSSDENYIRFTSDGYFYSVKYYNSDTDLVMVNAEYHSEVSGGRYNYHYYSYPKMPEYEKVQFFIYDSADLRGQETDYLVCSELLTQNDAYDTFALTSRGGQLSYSWTNYTTSIQEGGFGGPNGGGGPHGGAGGMGGGNTDKSDHSTKGIKAANEVLIVDGTVNIRAYDDAIHANCDEALENGKTPLGNVTVTGGAVSLYSNDDGIHADGTLSVSGGSIRVNGSYEGLEGALIDISDGDISIIAKDDGLNATATSGEAIRIGGGSLYIYCTGDGIDSNSRTSYKGIVFSGGRTVVIANSNGNCAIDSDSGYSYVGGSVVAIMNNGGMSSEAKKCQSFSSIGSYESISVKSGEYLVAEIGGARATVRMPVSMSCLVIMLGDSSAVLNTESSVKVELDANGVSWD